MKKFTITPLLVWLSAFAALCSGKKLREVIVSHTDDNGILQLYRMKEDGSDSVQLTHSEKGCRMPSVSPDGRNLLYMEEVKGSLSLWLSDINGRNARALVSEGMNLLPSWVPDSRHIVWMKTRQANHGQDPASNSQIHIMDTQTGKSRRLFSDPEQIRFSNAMPSVSPNSQKVAFVSNRSGAFRIWVSNLDGSDAKRISPPPTEQNEDLNLPIEQKVPIWSPDGKWVAHWEGVEMIHMSPFTGIKNPKRDQQISATFHVWVASGDGKQRRKVGRGDDPTWSPDGFVTRAFPDPKRGGPKVMIETETGEKELPIVPPRMNWGRFAWLPQLSKDLVTPAMTEEAPAPGKRVRQVAPEYEGTQVYHTLYLPTDWQKGKTYPVLVEYTGNKAPFCGSTGEVKGANLGYGLSGGKGFIWVSMPYIQKGKKENAVTWWGDRQATIDYCKVNLPRICKEFGGNPENLFLCGFSRGAIACGYLGLADDEIAAFWKGMIAHDHFDGHRKWGYPESDRASALKRLARLKGRPVLVCGNANDYLKEHPKLGAFTFLPVPVDKIFKIPEGPVIHTHTDLWAHRDSPTRKTARAWLQKQLPSKK